MQIDLRSLLKPVVRGVAWPLGWLGLDLRRVATLRFLPRYWSDRIVFVRAGGRITRSQSVLVDFAASSGTASGHYFHQDLLVARLVQAAAPRRLVDVDAVEPCAVEEGLAQQPLERLRVLTARDLTHLVQPEVEALGQPVAGGVRRELFGGRSEECEEQSVSGGHPS